MNPEEIAYFPCDWCLEDTEHDLNVHGAWECVECGEVLDEEVFRRLVESLPVSIWVIHQDQRRDEHGLSTIRRYRP